jgi:hypothetical protein
MGEGRIRREPQRGGRERCINMVYLCGSSAYEALRGFLFLALALL